MMQVYLKVKIKSLAAEAKIIRVEERRADDATTRCRLAEHRRVDVRRAARHALLAYGFLRHTAYREMERVRHTEPDWAEVARLVKRYGPPGVIDGLDRWRKEVAVRAELGTTIGGSAIAAVRSAVGLSKRRERAAGSGAL
jgi:hypothetical protein